MPGSRARISARRVLRRQAHLLRRDRGLHRPLPTQPHLARTPELAAALRLQSGNSPNPRRRRLDVNPANLPGRVILRLKREEAAHNLTSPVTSRERPPDATRPAVRAASTTLAASFFVSS